jgi:hypothetical protein
MIFHRGIGVLEGPLQCSEGASRFHNAALGHGKEAPERCDELKALD